MPKKAAPQEFITVEGAREHNLRDVSLSLPKGALICFTGVSGSGKSSLAFDTLYAEGQRRYLESLSTYARQFLGQLPRPEVTRITGLSPSISIQQKTSGWNPRSTVGTITQIHDYLRVLFARVGRQHCPACGQLIAAQSLDRVADRVLQWPAGTKLMILAPIVRGQKGEFRDLFDDLTRQGFARVRVDGEVCSLGETPPLKKNIKHHVEVVVDRLALDPAARGRLAEALELADRLAEGLIIAAPMGEGLTEQRFSTRYACAACERSFEPPTPQLLSFNSPEGMCRRCEGMGRTFDFIPELMVPDESKSLLALAVEPMRTKIGKWRKHIYQGVAKHVGFDLKTPWKDLPPKARHALLYGTGEAHITFDWRIGGGAYRHGGKFEGVVAELMDNYRKARSPMVRAYYEKYMREGQCPDCRGARLNEQARAIKLAGRNIIELGALPVDEALAFAESLGEPRTSVRADVPVQVDAHTATMRDSSSEPQASACATVRRGTPANKGKSSADRHDPPSMADRATRKESIALTGNDALIAEPLLIEIRARLRFLVDVGLSYLSLDRPAPSLSGGESQRIRLASQIGSGLTGVLYILDEPSIGLHARDNRRLLDSLLRLRDMGNTVIVVEHDEETMRAADLIVDFGPGPGVRGGEVVAQGTVEEIKRAKKSLTGEYLSGKRTIAAPRRRRRINEPRAV